MSPSRVGSLFLALSLIASVPSCVVSRKVTRTQAIAVNAGFLIGGATLAIGSAGSGGGGAETEQDVPRFDQFGIGIGGVLAVVGLFGLLTAYGHSAETEQGPPARPIPPPAEPVIAVDPFPDIVGSTQAMQLARQARVLAAAGNCGTARMVVRRIASIDPAYHDAAVSRDPALAACR